MKAFLKSILFLLVVGVGGAVALAWGSVPSNQQLKSLSTPQNVTEIVDLSKANLSFGEQGMTTSLTLTSQQFAQFIKLSLAGKSESEELAADLVDSDIRLQMPVSLGFIPSRAVLLGQPRLVDQELQIQVTSTKLGNLPVPKALFLTQLQEKAGSSLKVEGDTIKIPLALPIGHLTQLQVADGQLTVHLVVNESNLLSLLQQ